MKKIGNIMVSKGLKAIIRQNPKYATFLRMHEHPNSNKLAGVHCSDRAQAGRQDCRNNTKVLDIT